MSRPKPAGPVQIGLFEEVEHLDREAYKDRFRGPTIPALWDWAASSKVGGHVPRKGDIVPTWRCPDCHALCWSEFDLRLSHGWSTWPGAERPCDWAEFPMCYFQLRQHGQWPAEPPQKYPGVHGWLAGGVYGVIFCPDGYK